MVFVDCDEIGVMNLFCNWTPPGIVVHGGEPAVLVHNEIAHDDSEVSAQQVLDLRAITRGVGRNRGNVGVDNFNLDITRAHHDPLALQGLILHSW